MTTEQQNSIKSRGKRLRLLRKMSGLTLNELAQKYSIGVSTIKYWECAKNEGLSEKGAKKIILTMQAEGIQCSYMWLMHGVGLPPQFIDAHYTDLNKVVERDDASAFEEEQSISREIELFCNRISDAITLTVFDDAMEPIYAIGDGVGGKRLFGEDLSKAIGKSCIIETEDRRILCRKLAQGNSVGNFHLFCINPHTKASPPHLFDVKIISAAPISRIWKRLIS